ncbi:MAG: hypothetical protein WB245_09420 [Acidimicrobiia bacterium]
MSAAARARVTEIDLPDFGSPSESPRITPEIYESRLARLTERAADGYDRIVVYADREHSANISYLTGFDPRFEEAILVIGGTQRPMILTGNECVGMAKAAPLGMDVRLFQELSLPSQPRHDSPPLRDLFSNAGITAGSRVGIVGWKTFADDGLTDVPAYIVDTLRSLTGATGSVENATGILIDPQDGLRVINEVEQLAYFEYAACHTSTGVRNLISGIEPGMSEQEAVALLGWNGSPLSCHLMLTAGERARLGLLSPSDRRVARGDPLTVAYGIWGALNCRAGFVVESASDLPGDIQDYVDRLVAPYFETVAEWYQAIRIGQTGGALYEIVERRLGDPFFGIFLNPGHQIHLDEWVNSPVWPESEVELRSGMALQVDIIPATGTPYFTTNIEDGIALGDEGMRSELARLYPGTWQRIQGRRAFMGDVLGIDLHPDVLPLSNIPAYLPPYLLRPDMAMSLA